MTSRDPQAKSELATTRSADIAWMHQALALAQQAASIDEVPIGALIVKDGQVISTGYNLRETHQCVIRHAEMDAIAAACKQLGSWRLTGCELYVTLEPCLMCAGAIYQARISRVIFGALDPKAGAMGSLYSVHDDLRLNHRLPITSGVLAEECSTILKDFFRKKRT